MYSFYIVQYSVGCMKTILTLSSILLIHIHTCAQKYDLGISIGNNGNLDKTLNDYFHEWDEGNSFNDMYEKQTINLKFQLQAGHDLSANRKLNLKLGIARRWEHYSEDNPYEFEEVEFQQYVLSLVPELQFNHDLDRLALGFGLNLPFHYVGNLTANYLVRFKPDSPNGSGEFSDYLSRDGGLVMGIGTSIEIRYRLSDLIGIRTQIGSALLYASFGNEVNGWHQDTERIEYVYNDQYKKFFFSTPELSCGVYFRI